MNEIASGVAHLPILFVNVYFVGAPGEPWVLVDTGLPGFANRVRDHAAQRYGADSPPQAIILTHGHFDHASNARALAEEWDVPVFAHHLELPYLDGRSNYPPRDPTVGGAMAFLSRVMPDKGIDIGPHLRELPEGEVPFLPDWRVHFTPGHSAGHISLFRPSDRTLLAGDALTTENTDTWPGLMMQIPEIGRPPAPFNSDWQAAQSSVQLLAALRPFSIGAGHGVPMVGDDIADELESFAAEFALPSHGRYADEAAVADENGVVSLPPPVADPLPKVALVVAGLSVAALLMKRRAKRRGDA